MTEPTDDEIDALVAAYLGDCGPQATRVYSFVRAVLAKWGTPAPVGAEPVEKFDNPLVQAVYAILCDDTDWPPKETPQQHWEGWIARRIVDQVLAMGRVPLTDEQLYLERRFAVSSLFHLIEQWTDKKIQSHQLADEAGKIVDHVIRRTEAAHGIKVGQHGTDN